MTIQEDGTISGLIIYKIVYDSTTREVKRNKLNILVINKVINNKGK